MGNTIPSVKGGSRLDVSEYAQLGLATPADSGTSYVDGGSDPIGGETTGSEPLRRVPSHRGRRRRQKTPELHDLPVIVTTPRTQPLGTPDLNTSVLVTF